MKDSGTAYLPENDIDADERLLNAAAHYVVEKEMPIKTAREILLCNLKNKCEFETIIWVKFIALITQLK